MNLTNKIQYFKHLTEQPPAWRLVVLTLILLLLIPINLFHRRGGHWIELVKNVSALTTREKLKVYSVLKSHMPRTTDKSVWDLAQTIIEESKKHSLDPMLVLAVIKVESRFKDSAVSGRGARGLMQIRPFVADALAEEIKWQGERNLDDPILNIKLGVLYLGHLKKRFRDLELALAAYNWGPTEIRSRLDEQEEVPLDYSTKVLSAYSFYRRGRLPQAN
jgi:hypothetical protein